MRVTINNNIQLSNKYVRFIKWKLSGLSRKFEKIIYAEVFLNAEGSSPKRYKATIRMGVPGNDIIITKHSENLKEVLGKSLNAIQRHIARHKFTTVENG